MQAVWDKAELTVPILQIENNSQRLEMLCTPVSMLQAPRSLGYRSGLRTYMNCCVCSSLHCLYHPELLSLSESLIYPPCQRWVNNVPPSSTPGFTVKLFTQLIQEAAAANTMMPLDLAAGVLDSSSHDTVPST